ncbi:MAG: replication factor [Thermoproteota archaeon]|nr:replication factor [Thermoproteota archaeon]
MDYQELYEAWKREKKGTELQALDKKFYSNLSQYIKDQIEDSETLDENAIKGRLIARECMNMKRLLTSLVECRYRKILKEVLDRKQIPLEILTDEEEIIYSSILSTRNETDLILKDTLRGRVPEIKEIRIVEKPKRILVRFLQAIPAIVGQDIRAYGPFKAEDVAALPFENAEILIKRGVAKEVEV